MTNLKTPYTKTWSLGIENRYFIQFPISTVIKLSGEARFKSQKTKAAECLNSNWYKTQNHAYAVQSKQIINQQTTSEKWLKLRRQSSKPNNQWCSKLINQSKKIKTFTSAHQAWQLIILKQQDKTENNLSSAKIMIKLLPLIYRQS